MTDLSEHLCLYIEHKPMGVPYQKPERDDPSLAYIDLKRFPDERFNLPELATWPEALEFIETINGTELFSTIGIGAWARRERLTIHFVSYLQFCFDYRDSNGEALNYYSLFHQFSVYLVTRSMPDDLRISFLLTRTDFNGPKPLLGWSARIVINNYGRSAKSARATPNDGYRLLSEFLASLLVP